MTENAPVAVVVPCYNASITLQRAVDSIFAQSVRPAEVILVDDASTDDTGAIIQELERRYPQVVRGISLVRNMGPSYARNIGWDASTSDYVAFLDSDDEWHPNKLEIQMGWLHDHADVSMCGHLCVQHPGQGIVLPINTILKLKSFNLHDMLVSNRFSTPSVIVRRSISHRFPVSRRHAEDYQLWLLIVAEVERVYRIELPLAWYFKPPYGVSGLSAAMWSMELGELAAISRVRRLGRLSIIEWLGFSLFSLTKFIWRYSRHLVSKVT